MAKYNPLSTELVKELESIVGAKNITVDPEKMETYSHDEETDRIAAHDAPFGFRRRAGGGCRQNHQ